MFVRSMTLLAAAAMVSVASVRSVQAGPLKASNVPADSKWVIHIDMDRVRGGEAWKTIDAHLQTDGEAQTKIDQVAAMTGMHFPQDVRDITVFGKAIGDQEATVLFHGSIDRQRTMTLLQMNESFSSKPAGNNHEVISWTDKGQANYGAFFDDSTVIIGHNVDQVASELATLDDAEKAVKPDSPMLAGATDDQLVYLGIGDVSLLKKAANTPLLQKIDNAWLSVGENAGGLLVNAKLQTKDPTTAQQVNQSITGLVAMVSLMSGNSSPDPNIAILSQAVQTVTTSVDATAVNIRWPIAQKLFSEAADRATSKPSE